MYLQAVELDHYSIPSAQEIHTEHRRRMEKVDAEKLVIPHIVLASKDEPVETVRAYSEIIKGNGKGGLVDTYPSMWHGWMGARANLEEEESRDQYARG